MVSPWAGQMAPMHESWMGQMQGPMMESMTPPHWQMPESTRECESSSSYKHHHMQDDVEPWHHMPAMQNPQVFDSQWNFGPQMPYHPMMHQQMMWPGHCGSEFPPAHHWPQPQPYFMPNFPQAGYESC